MAKRARAQATGTSLLLAPACRQCWECQGPLRIVYYKTRTIVTLAGLRRLRLQIRRCVNPNCSRYHHLYRPEAEGVWALPHAEVGLDVIAHVGALRFAEHRSVPEIHRDLATVGVAISVRAVTYLLERYEELLAVRLTDPEALRTRLGTQDRVILALDGLQPDVGHEVLWVLRDVLSGEILLARSLRSATEADLSALLREVQAQLPVPIRGVISDGQTSIRKAVQTALPGVPHPLCQFHYLREAALPIYEADRHAKKELKKRVRGVRPIERRLEAQLPAARDRDPAPEEPLVPEEPTALKERAERAERAEQVEQVEQAELEAVRGYCLAIRSALTDDGRPPLAAAGLQLQARLTEIHTSVERVLAARSDEKGGSPRS